MQGLIDARATTRWTAFLAGTELSTEDVAAIGDAVAAQGPLAAIGEIEARRALGHVDRLDPIGRAMFRIATRSVLQQAPPAGVSLVIRDVLHRRNPVLAPPIDEHPLITARAVTEWWTVRDLVADLAEVPPASPVARAALNGALDANPHRLHPAQRSRLAHAPVILAALTQSLATRAADGLASIAASLSHLADLDDPEPALCQAIDRLWLGATIEAARRHSPPAAKPVDDALSDRPEGVGGTRHPGSGSSGSGARRG